MCAFMPVRAWWCGVRTGARAPKLTCTELVNRTLGRETPQLSEPSGLEPAPGEVGEAHAGWGGAGWGAGGSGAGHANRDKVAILAWLGLGPLGVLGAGTMPGHPYCRAPIAPPPAAPFPPSQTPLAAHQLFPVTARKHRLRNQACTTHLTHHHPTSQLPTRARRDIKGGVLGGVDGVHSVRQDVVVAVEVCCGGRAASASASAAAAAAACADALRKERRVPPCSGRCTLVSPRRLVP